MISDAGVSDLRSAHGACGRFGMIGRASPPMPGQYLREDRLAMFRGAAA